MRNQKINFETTIGMPQYLLTALRALIVIVPTFALAIRTWESKTLFISIIILGIILSTFLILRTLKIFQITRDFFIVKRCLFKDEVFQISQIKEIKFLNIKIGRGSHIPIMRIISNNGENEYYLIYSGRQLEMLIQKLRDANLQIENAI